MVDGNKSSKFNIYFYKTASGKETVLSFINSFDEDTKVKIRNGIRLLGGYGLLLMNTPWMKKVYKDPSIYELRIRSKVEVRLLFFLVKPNNFVFVHGFVKKTNKLPKQDLQLAIKRCKEFI